MIDEKLLHYLWKFRLLRNLKTISGESIDILSPGIHNQDAGPDFFNARLRIGNTVWAGNVEMHIRTSDWYKHGHQHDAGYSNVILHAVYENDSDQTDDRIPLAELKNHIPNEIISRYHSLSQSKAWVPCAGRINDVRKLTIDTWLERILAERLEQKAALFRNTLIGSGHSWEESFYRQLAMNFGFKLNAMPFELLARITPLKVLARHKNSLIQIEAVLFGQAGLLDEKVKDAYFEKLVSEYSLMKNKFRLKPMDKSMWKFARTRPGNFPTIRIAQFAALIFKSSHLFSTLLETSEANKMISLFNCEASGYWKNHYRFGRASTVSKPKPLGKQAVENLLINTVAPALFLYGIEKDQQRMKEKAVSLLQHLPAEKNHITNGWTKTGLKVRFASESQALIQLKRFYCSRFQCLSCSIGNELLNLSPQHATTD